MRFLTTLLAAAALLINVGDAAAQGTTTSNTVSTGPNRNANTTSNSQFLSGSNTGVNNGSLEVYAGADPYQGFTLEGSVNLPQLPGLMQAPSNFSQPYKPDKFVNGPAFLPGEMTVEEAKTCRDSKVTWYGGSREETQSIKLFYAMKQETPGIPLTMGNYIGTAMATTTEGPFLAALCEAAYRAMRRGATIGMVDFTIRPRNTMFGIGFGGSGGATGLPAAGAHPYALAATLGFGTGWSNQKVEGDVLVQLTALRGAPGSAAVDPASSSPSAQPAASKPDPGSSSPSAQPSVSKPVAPEPAPTTPDSTDQGSSRDGRHSPVGAVLPGRPITKDRSGTTAIHAEAAASSRAVRVTPKEVVQLTAARDAAEVSQDFPGPTFSQARREAPVAAPILLTRSRPRQLTQDRSGTAATSAEPATSTRAGRAEGKEPSRELAFHSPKKLASLRSGDRKERVFDAFGSAFVTRNGSIVEIDGMRLRASGRSPRNTSLEVSEVKLAEPDGPPTTYWFLFEDQQLIAWGRSEQWREAAVRYRLDLRYPEWSPLRAEAKVGLEASH